MSEEQNTQVAILFLWVGPLKYKAPHATKVTFLKVKHVSVHKIDNLHKTLLKSCFSIQQTYICLNLLISKLIGYKM